MSAVDKSWTLRAVMKRAEREARVLAGEFARTAERDREAVLAGIEIEQWIVKGCEDLIEHRYSG